MKYIFYSFLLLSLSKFISFIFCKTIFQQLLLLNCVNIWRIRTITFKKNGINENLKEKGKIIFLPNKKTDKKRQKLFFLGPQSCPVWGWSDNLLVLGWELYCSCKKKIYSWDHYIILLLKGRIWGLNLGV